jgi:glycosyltransferase involved in cell wall biosynthesis
LHLGKFFPPHVGGMETCLADLLAAQQSQGTPAFALVHGDPLPGDPPWLSRVPVQAQVMYAPIAWGYRRALASAIERFKPDVLHLHMPNTSVLWALTLACARELPWIVHWHSDVLFAKQRWAPRLAYRLYQPFEEAVLARAQRVVATSPPYLDASRPLRRWRAKCGVVPLGLQPPAGNDGPVEAPPRPGHAWTAGRLRVLSLGRLAHYKGFDTLIRAVAGLGPQAELLIAGDGELRGELQSLIAGLTAAPAHRGGAAPNIRLLGAVSEAEKQALLASCDVFALASCERTEAFGMVLLEAMSHGKPCLVSDLPGSGMPWVVGTSQAGQALETGNAEAWRAALLSMARQPQQRLAWGRAGKAAFDSRFTAAASAQAWRQEYRHALGARAAPRAQGAILIVIPARNEARTIGALLGRLRDAGHRDVVVIDDLSDDGTGDIARREGAKVLRPVLGLGAWGGMQTGIRYALQQGYQTVITMDADGQHEVDELPALLAAGTQGRQAAEVVIGAHPERASRLRHVAWNWFRWLTGLDVTDLTSGFRCYRARALPILASDEATLLDYQDVGTLLLLRHAGLEVIEVPVSMNPRVDGISRIFNSWLSVARYMAVTTLLCLSRWGERAADAQRD